MEDQRKNNKPIISVKPNTMLGAVQKNVNSIPSTTKKVELNVINNETLMKRSHKVNINKINELKNKKFMNDEFTNQSLNLALSTLSIGKLNFMNMDRNSLRNYYSEFVNYNKEKNTHKFALNILLKIKQEEILSKELKKQDEELKKINKITNRFSKNKEDNTKNIIKSQGINSINEKHHLKKKIEDMQKNINNVQNNKIIEDDINMEIKPKRNNLLKQNIKEETMKTDKNFIIENGRIISMNDNLLANNQTQNKNNRFKIVNQKNVGYLINTSNVNINDTISIINGKKYITPPDFILDKIIK